MVNVGQVKRLAQPFYDRLRAAQAAGLNVSNALPLGMRGAYPWSGAANSPADDAAANVGQLKQAFSFDLNRDGDGLPDWWEWKWFHDYAFNGTSLDANGNTLLDDYNNDVDPDPISFTLRLGNRHFNTTTVSGSYLVLNGAPGQQAILVNSTNFDGAAWTSYIGTNFTFAIGPTDGVYQVWFGLKGFNSNSVTSWFDTQVYLDRAVPAISLTNPIITGGVATVSKPYLQLQGLADKQLARLNYDLSNAFGVFTNQPCQVTDQVFDTNRFDFTTNYFWAYDVPLANADNWISLHVTDLAGNTATTNFDVVLDYSKATNLPTVALVWPQDGMTVGSTNLTIRGTLSDETGGIQATVVNGNVTNVIAGLVERNHDFWIENVPLNGSGQITLQAIDAAGNVAVTNINVNANAMTFTIDSVPTGSNLWNAVGSVGGHISDATANVFVNGVQGTNNGDGTWSAGNVPIYGTGTATFDASASHGNGAQNPAVKAQAASPTQITYTCERPPQVIVSHHEFTQEARQFTLKGGNSYDPDSLQVNNGTVTYNASLAVDTNNNWTLNCSGFEDLYRTIIPIRRIGHRYTGTWTQTGASPTNLLIPSIPVNDWARITGYPTVKVSHFHAGARFWYDRSVGTNGDISRLYVAVDSKTSLKLYTGGKAQAGNRNLLSLQMSAYTYSPTLPSSSLYMPWLNAKLTPFTNYWDARINDSRPGPDGRLWEVMPDNASQEINASLVYFGTYSIEITPAKYKVDINLSTATTNANLTTDVPEVCVGQKVTFALTNLPMDQIVNMVGNWQLPNKYVNHFWQNHHTVGTYPAIPYEEYYGSTNYDVDNSLLSNTNQISCWFYNDNGGMVSVGLNFLFKNGQSASIAVLGSLKVIKPMVFPLDASDAPFRASIDNWEGNTWLGLSSNAMHFKVYISKTHPGQLGLTQLVKMYSQTGTALPPFINWHSTSGAFWLDGSDEYYNSRKIDLSDTIWPSNEKYDYPVEINDAPGLALGALYGFYDGEWQTYVRFMPDEIDGIPVTLGRVDWKWDAVANTTNGIWQVTADSGSTPILNTHIDAFPEWTDVRPSPKDDN